MNNKNKNNKIMSKYLHYFETESEFNEQYNGSDYTEPWVSYTKYRGGDVLKFVGDYTLEGTLEVITDENLEFSYAGKAKGNYRFLSNASSQTITATDIDSGTGEVYAIRVNGLALSQLFVYEDGRCVWNNKAYFAITDDKNPNPGDTCVYYTDSDSMSIVIEARNPEVGVTYEDFTQGAMVLVKSITGREELEDISKPNYNRLMLTIKAGECENSDIFRFTEYTGNTYNRNVKAEDVVKLMARAYNRNGGDTEPTPEPLWNKYVDLYLIKNTREGPEILGTGIFIWDNETINLTPNEKMDLALNHMTTGQEQTPLNPIILNVNTGKINPEFNDCEIRIARIDIL